MLEAFAKTELTQGQLLKQALGIKDSGAYALVSPDPLPVIDQWGMVHNDQNFLTVKIEPGNLEILTKWIVEWVHERKNFLNHSDYIQLHYVDDFMTEAGSLPVFLWSEENSNTIKNDTDLCEEISNLLRYDFNISQLEPEPNSQLKLSL